MSEEEAMRSIDIAAEPDPASANCIDPEPDPASANCIDPEPDPPSSVDAVDVPEPAQPTEEELVDDAVFPGLQVGDAWGESITKERAAELDAKLQAWEQDANHGERTGPFDTSGLDSSERDRLRLTGADVLWFAARGLTTSDDPQAVAEQVERLQHAHERQAFNPWLDLPELNLSGANLVEAKLSGAYMRGADLADAYLFGANLSGAVLNAANLSGANLTRANLSEAGLREANLSGAVLNAANLSGANLTRANLSEAGLREANLSGAVLNRTNLRGAILGEANLMKVNLFDADLTRANLRGANLMKANLSATNFSGANLLEVDLSGADLYAANLSGAGLTRANLDNQTDLTDAVLTDTPHWYSALVNYRRHKNSFGPAGMADIGWNDFAAFKLVNWSGLRHVGDERRKRAPWRAKGDMDAATRAYTQLSKRLREVGMHEDADRFAYRAKICQRRIHFLRGHLLRWLFSWLLFVIAGYGYRPLRTLFWYVVVIFGFSLVYVNVGHVNGQPFQLGEALVFSLASFHGRGFFPGTQSLTDMSTQLAVLEATVGLFIEVIFISTFTQRYFQK